MESIMARVVLVLDWKWSLQQRTSIRPIVLPEYWTTTKFALNRYWFYSGGINILEVKITLIELLMDAGTGNIMCAWSQLYVNLEPT